MKCLDCGAESWPEKCVVRHWRVFVLNTVPGDVPLYVKVLRSLNPCFKSLFKYKLRALWEFLVGGVSWQAVDDKSRISHMVSQAVIVVSCMYSKTNWFPAPTSIVQFRLLF